MRLGVLGTGRVGSTIAGKLIQLGHEVMMGSRDAANEKAQSWARGAGERASCGAFADAAAFGETVINCTAGGASLDALEAAGAANLNGKVLIDISNPLDVSKGMPPSLTVCNNDSLGEQIQRAFPEAKVVKTLNTVNHQLMVDPSKVPGDHHVFVSGDDEGAKASVVDLLGSFGWPKDRVIDLGDISTARGPEMYLPLWLRLMIKGNFARHFNIQVLWGAPPA
jgi:8-hydroxy-5-deazaflavin:NADPH oxidoreductase